LEEASEDYMHNSDSTSTDKQFCVSTTTFCYRNECWVPLSMTQFIKSWLRLLQI